MKKSYDYFKTLKELSKNVEETFSNALKSGNCEIGKISFSGMKNELLNNLQNEFIAPIERGDIFILTDCLSRELVCAGAVREFAPLFWSECFCLCESLEVSFAKQSDVFTDLGKQKEYSRLLVSCRDSAASVSSTVSLITRKIKACVSCAEAQPLLKYSVYAVLLEISRSQLQMFSELERTILNNS